LTPAPHDRYDPAAQPELEVAMMPNLQKSAPEPQQFTRQQLHDALIALMNLAQHLHSQSASPDFPFASFLQSEIGGETADVLTRIAREMWSPDAYGEEWEGLRRKLGL